MTKVIHTIFIKDKINIIVVSDLIYQNDIPHISLAVPGERPFVVVPIDASKLHPIFWQEAQFVYELPIELSDKFYEKVKLLENQKL